MVGNQIMSSKYNGSQIKMVYRGIFNRNSNKNKQANKHGVTFLFLNFSSFFVPREYCLEVKSVHK